jgi:hypothetical protein
MHTQASKVCACRQVSVKYADKLTIHSCLLRSVQARKPAGLDLRMAPEAG